MFRTIERYEDTGLGLPYPVTLLNAAEELLDDETGESLGVRVPNLEGLAAAVAVARCLDPMQLAGQEVRFVRHTLSLTQRELANQLEIAAAETISRWENGATGEVGGYVEKLLRALVVVQLKDRAPGIAGGAERIPALRIRSRHEGEWPVLTATVVHQPAGSDALPEYSLPLAA